MASLLSPLVIILDQLANPEKEEGTSAGKVHVSADPFLSGYASYSSLK